MAKRKPRFIYDGVLVVDKPVGPTSHDVVARLRGRFKPAKLGHAGTLDPFATGVLVLAFNQATRLMELLGAGRKVYRGVLALGAATDTGDPTGQVTEEAPVPAIETAEVERILAAMVGDRLQEPPAYSAAKYLGKPLYAYARAGVSIKKPPRPITIHATVLHGLDEGRIDFEIACSRGTYVRSLAQEIAHALGTVGHLVELRRTESAPFGQEKAISFDEAARLSDAELETRMLGCSEALKRCGLPAVDLDDELTWQLRQGRILEKAVLLAKDNEGEVAGADAFRVLAPDGELAAVLRWLKPGQKKPGRDYETIRVFPERLPPRAGAEATPQACGAE